MTGLTMFDKIWDEHLIATLEDGTDLLHIDRHILHEMTSVKAFEDLRGAGRPVHGRTYAGGDGPYPRHQSGTTTVATRRARPLSSPSAATSRNSASRFTSTMPSKASST